LGRGHSLNSLSGYRYLRVVSQYEKQDLKYRCLCLKKLPLLVIFGVRNYFCKSRSFPFFGKHFPPIIYCSNDPGVEGSSNLGLTLTEPRPAHRRKRLKSSTSCPAVSHRCPEVIHSFLLPCGRLCAVFNRISSSFVRRSSL
jgi:hypothetical protein